MNELRKILDDIRISDEIVNMLPDDAHTGLVILSMAVDEYAKKCKGDPDTFIRIMYEAHLQVRADLGHYPGGTEK